MRWLSRLLVLVLAAMLAAGAAPLFAAQPDAVAQLLATVRQADALVAQIRSAARAGDIAALRTAVGNYVATIQSAVAQVRTMTTGAANTSTANSSTTNSTAGTAHALEVVQQATLKQQAALQKAAGLVHSDQAKAALERAMAAAQTGYAHATQALQNAGASSGQSNSSGHPAGPPAGTPGGPPAPPPGGKP